MKINDAKIRAISNEFKHFVSNSKRVSAFNDVKRYEITYISIEQLKPYNKQARKIFVDEEIEQLSITIKEHGIRQPLTVLRNNGERPFFEVISGERRLRAAKLIGLNKVPCIIVEDVDKAEEIALVENIQRQDLHPMEVARALKSLIDRIDLGGRANLTSKIGLSSSQISELIKLTTLDIDIQNIILEKNFRGRENFRKLYTISSNEEKINFINSCSVSLPKEAKKTFSVLRLAFNDGELKIQKNSFGRLTLHQKNIVKESLCDLINEIDLLIHNVDEKKF